MEQLADGVATQQELRSWRSHGRADLSRFKNSSVENFQLIVNKYSKDRFPKFPTKLNIHK
eukprot:5896015-Amphidinium_carterae.1